jgi:hypothetical protein
MEVQAAHYQEEVVNLEGKETQGALVAPQAD